MSADLWRVLIIEASWLLAASAIFLCFSFISRMRELKALLPTDDAPTAGDPSTDVTSST